MGTVSKTFTFSAGGTITASEHNTNFDTLYNLVNGNIDNDNIKAAAGIVDTKLAQITTASKVSNTALTVASQAQGDILYYNGSAWTRLGYGTDSQSLKTNGSGANPAWENLVWSDLPDGSVVQVVNTQSGALATSATATALPYDNTSPSTSEGDAYSGYDTTITPKASTNKLRVDVVIHVNVQLVSATGAVALYNTDIDGSNAIACGHFVMDNTSEIIPVAFTHYCTAPGTSATTFTIRVGHASTERVTINGVNNTATYNGLIRSSITITEIKAS